MIGIYKRTQGCFLIALALCLPSCWSITDSLTTPFVAEATSIDVKVSWCGDLFNNTKLEGCVHSNCSHTLTDVSIRFRLIDADGNLIDAVCYQVPGNLNGYQSIEFSLTSYTNSDKIQRVDYIVESANRLYASE